MSASPLLVGVTGGIGSGKSVACRIFQLLGIPVYNADDRAKALMIEDPLLKIQITEAFGSRAYANGGSLDRQYLAQTVFSDKAKLEVLNGLVHPAVAKDFLQWSASQPDSPYLIKEAALIFEAGSNKMLDYTVLVAAPESLRISRVLARDPQRSRQQVRDIMSKQWPDETKENLADFVIRNDEAQLLIPQVLAIDAVLRKVKKKARPAV